MVIEADIPLAEAFLALDALDFLFRLELFRGLTFSSIKKLPPFFYFDFSLELFAPRVPVEDLESDLLDLDRQTSGIMDG